MERIYACIDLKSFYASVECALRGLDPLTTNLVVADASRTEKTICLAVSPSLKKYGIPGRARLFEVIKEVNKINYNRKKDNNYRRFIGKSYDDNILSKRKDLELDFIAAPPQMAKYIEYSTMIYNIYLKYLSSDDIYVYSIDEVFCDITDYLEVYKKTPKELITMIIHDVYNTTKITATAGIGTNLYLAKVAMDITSKKCDADEYGVRIAYLDEMDYRRKLWDYRPLNKFWRVGPGISKKLEDNNIYTMGDIARTSIDNEDKLYKLFGVTAELLIDHAWGYEPCSIKDIKKYKPSSNSLSSGQVLHSPYNYEKTRLIIKEMIDLISLSLTEKGYKTNQIVIMIGYDIGNVTSNNDIEITTDYYGRKVPKSDHGSINLEYYSSSCSVLTEASLKLFDKIINKKLLVRRINISVNNLIHNEEALSKVIYKQYDLFSNDEKDDIINYRDKEEEDNNIQKVIVDIKKKYGKNAIIKGMNLEDGGTTIERNKQIGGHKE